MQNPLKRSARDETDQGVSDKPVLGTQQIRLCDRCYRELPSDFKYKKCDDCRNWLAKTVTVIGGATVAITSLAVRYGPMAGKAVAKIITKKK